MVLRAWQTPSALMVEAITPELLTSYVQFGRQLKLVLCLANYLSIATILGGGAKQYKPLQKPMTLEAMRISQGGATPPLCNPVQASLAMYAVLLQGIAPEALQTQAFITAVQGETFADKKTSKDTLKSRKKAVRDAANNLAGAPAPQPPSAAAQENLRSPGHADQLINGMGQDSSDDDKAAPEAALEAAAAAEARLAAEHAEDCHEADRLDQQLRDQPYRLDLRNRALQLRNPPRLHVMMLPPITQRTAQPHTGIGQHSMHHGRATGWDVLPPAKQQRLRNHHNPRTLVREHTPWTSCACTATVTSTISLHPMSPEQLQHLLFHVSWLSSI